MKPIDEFVNPDCRRAYTDLVQLHDAFRNAVNDLTHTLEAPDDPIVLFLDYSIVFPLVTPRDNVSPTSESHKQDYSSLQFLLNLRKYKSVIGVIPVYSPFLILELFDQIQHRKAFYESVISARDTRAAISALRASLPRVPHDPKELEAELSKVVDSVKNSRLAERISTFIDLIKTGVIRSIFEFVARDRFMAYFNENIEIIDQVYDSIDKFRRQSLGGDPSDREFHKLVDVFIVSFISNHRKYTNHPVKFVGPDRLRRIFADQLDFLSRDILSPYVMLKELSEVPSDRNLCKEALSSLSHRLKRIQRMMDDLYEVRSLHKVPYAIIEDIYNDDMKLKKFIYGEFKMQSSDKYNQMLKRISERIPEVQTLFSEAADDAKSAEEMLKEMAQSVVNTDFEEIVNLRPNDRLRKLFNDLNR